MAAGRMSIEEKIKRAEIKLSKMKERYDAAADELKTLLEKRKNKSVKSCWMLMRKAEERMKR